MTIAFIIVFIITVFFILVRQNRADKSPLQRKNMLDQDVFSERNSTVSGGSSDYTQSYDDALHRESIVGNAHHTAHTSHDAFTHSHSDSHANHDSWGHSSDFGGHDSMPTDSTSFDSSSSGID